MATLAQVRAGIKTTLSLTGIEVYEQWPDLANVPSGKIAVIITPSSGQFSDPHTTFSGRGTFWLDLVVLAQIGQLKDAQNTLDPYLDLSGSGSIIGKLEADQTLNSTAESFITPGWQDYGDTVINNSQFLMARLPLEIWVTT